MKNPAALHSLPRLTAALLGTTLCIAAAPNGFAQSNAPDARELAGQNPPPRRLKTLPPDQPPRFHLSDDITLPQVPEVQSQQQVVTIDVKRIEVTGVTLLAPEPLNAVLARYEGRPLTLEEIQSAANEITKLYITAGYLNSGVLVPDQDASDGVIRMTAVEGTLNDIVLEGNEHLRDSYIEKRVRASMGPNLNVYELEESLRLMQLSPLIDQVNAQIVPGKARGESLLNLRVTENDPMVVRAEYNNFQSPSVGENQGLFSFGHNSLTGNGDYLLLNYGVTEGVNSVYATYGIPLTPKDLTWETYYSKSDQDIVQSPFEELDIVSELNTWGTRLYRPVYRTLNHDVTVGLGFEHTKTENTLLDTPYSFSPGEEFGKSEVSLLRLTGEWIWRREQDALFTRAAISYGVDWLNATDNSDVSNFFTGETIDDLPDSSFTALLLQSNYVRVLPWQGIQLLGRVTAQATPDPLLSSQKLAMGGARTVRGYVQNQLVRDNGVIASAELRIPLFQDDNHQSRYGLTLAPFFDYGWAKDEAIGIPGLENPESDDIKSIGAGVIWNWWKPWYVEIYYGEKLNDIEYEGNDLQEEGFSIQTYLEWTF